METSIIPIATVNLNFAYRMALLLVGFISCPAFAKSDIFRKITIRDSINSTEYGKAFERTIPDGALFETRETIYYNALGNPVQRDTTTFNPDSLEVIRYIFENSETGERVELKATNDEVVIENQPTRKSQLEITTIKKPSGSILGKTLDRWILKHKKKLDRGESIPIKLFVPSKADSYSFQVRQKKTQQNSPEDTYIIEPRNWFIRLFIPHLELSFSKTSPTRLTKIIGPYPILSDEKRREKQVVYDIDLVSPKIIDTHFGNITP